jgi:hypothetical protein
MFFGMVFSLYSYPLYWVTKNEPALLIEHSRTYSGLKRPSNTKPIQNLISNQVALTELPKVSALIKILSIHSGYELNAS